MLGTVYDRARDISHQAEAIKRRHLADGRPDLCLTDMDEYTFGYHPKSLLCARCPLTQQCIMTLQNKYPFDVVALRNGQINMQQANLVTGGIRCGG